MVTSALWGATKQASFLRNFPYESCSLISYTIKYRVKIIREWGWKMIIMIIVLKLGFSSESPGNFKKILLPGSHSSSVLIVAQALGSLKFLQ